MFLLIIGIVLISILIFELIALIYWYFRTRYFIKNPIKICPNCNENFLLEFMSQIERINDFDEMFNIYFHGRKVNQVTKAELHTFLKRNIYNPDATHYPDRYMSNFYINNYISPKMIEIDNKILDIINAIEIKTNYSFSIEKAPNVTDHYINGRENVKSNFMPLTLLLAVKIVKMFGYISVQLRGYSCDSGDYGMSFAYRRNKKFKHDKILILCHGVGFGYTTYLDLAELFSTYKHIILLELPNISFGQYVGDYPMPNEIIDSISQYINTKFDYLDIIKGIDVLGHSYGSLAISQFVRYKHDTHVDEQPDWIKSTEYITLIDPICFFETMHNTIEMITTGRNLYLSRLNHYLDDKTFNSYIKYMYNYVIYVLFYDLLFKHLELQLIFARKTFLIKSLFPVDYINDKLIVILSGKDIIINSYNVYDNIKTTSANVKLIKTFDHCDIMFIDETVEHICDFINDIVSR